MALWLREASRWSKLRNIGNSGPVKLTILIPVVGYFIIFNAKLADYLNLISVFGGPSDHQQFSISPRLLFVYVGLCAFAVGATIYSYLCPTQVKHYGSSAAYVRGDGPAIKDFEFEPIEKTLRESPRVKEYMRIRDRYEKSYVGQSQPLTIAQKEEINNATLHLYFDYLDKSHPRMRLTSLICYASGLVLLLIPSTGVFVRVVGLLFSALVANPWSIF